MLLDVEEACFEERLKWMPSRLKGPYIAGSMINPNFPAHVDVSDWDFGPNPPKNDIARRMLLRTDEDYNVIQEELSKLDRSYEIVSSF